MKTDNLILKKTFDFSLSIIKLYTNLISEKEFIISKQLLRSATPIGANVEESIAAQSRKDLYQKCQLLQRKQENLSIGYVYYQNLILQILT